MDSNGLFSTYSLCSDAAGVAGILSVLPVSYSYLLACVCFGVEKRDHTAFST